MSIRTAANYISFPARIRVRGLFCCTGLRRMMAGLGRNLFLWRQAVLPHTGCGVEWMRRWLRGETLYSRHG
jgi:hypothetical protein